LNRAASYAKKKSSPPAEILEGDSGGGPTQYFNCPFIDRSLNGKYIRNSGTGGAGESWLRRPAGPTP